VAKQKPRRQPASKMDNYPTDPARQAAKALLIDPDDLLDAEILERRRLQALVTADDSAQKDQDD
jgi:hypothetical protein